MLIWLDTFLRWRPNSAVVTGMFIIYLFPVFLLIFLVNFCCLPSFSFRILLCCLASTSLFSSLFCFIFPVHFSKKRLPWINWKSICKYQTKQFFWFIIATIQWKFLFWPLNSRELLDLSYRVNMIIDYFTLTTVLK